MKSNFKVTAAKLYGKLFPLAPWAVLAGLLQYHFRSFLPLQRLFTGLQFFDFITVTDIFVGLLVFLFVIGVATRTLRLKKRALPWEWKASIGFLMFAAVLQLGFQQVYEPILSTPFEYFRSLFIFPLLLTTMGFLTLDEKAVKALMRSYFWMVGVFCVAALAQYFGGFFPGESKDFMGRLVWPFIDFVTLKSSSANWAAFFVTPAVVLFFIKAFSTRGRWPYPLLFLLTSVTLYLTQSYGGYAAVIAGITLYLFRAQPYKKFVISLLIISAVIGAGYLHQHTTWKYQVLTGESDYRYANSAASRGDIYRMDLSMILTNPLLGVGMNQYQNYFAAHQQEVLEHELNESHVPPHAHNFFLSFWTSLGFFGFLAMIILILGLFWRTKFDPGSPAVFVIVAIMVHGLIDSWYWKQDTAYIFWLMIMFAYLYRLPVRGKK